MGAGQKSRRRPGRAEDLAEQKSQAEQKSRESRRSELGGRSESSRRAEQKSSRSKRRSSGAARFGDKGLRRGKEVVDGDGCQVSTGWVVRAGVDGGATAEVKNVGDAGGRSCDAEVLEVGDLVPVGKVERVGVDVRDRGEQLAKVGSDGKGFIHRWAGRHGDNGGEESGDLGKIEARNVGLNKLHGEVESLGLQARGGGDGGKGRSKRDVRCSLRPTEAVM
jgi:hypothetical protein